MYVDEIYEKTLADNETALKLWENYLKGLKAVNFNAYSDKLKVPVLVPIGKRIFFRGELKHTNEVTVSLGAGYFVKCSTEQAEVLRQHRIKGAQSLVDQYRKEKEYLEKQISLTKQTVYNKEGQEILEVYSEEEDKAWREKHRENVRKYKQETAKKETIPENALPDDNELWEKLEELELQEELENEMLDNFNEIVDKRKENTFLINEKSSLLNSFKDDSKKSYEKNNNVDKDNKTHSMKLINKVDSTENKKDFIKMEKISSETSNNDLLQQILDKQNELANKLHELKYREREQSRTEQDLIARLDEMEKLDELEDDMERLDDILQTEDVELDDDQSEDDSSKSGSIKLRKCISFADEDNNETLEITFKHSDAEANNDPYNPEKGISKPSDLYDAYSSLFDNKTTSILKKSKYESEDLKTGTLQATATRQVKFEDSLESYSPGREEISSDRTIIINDVIENAGVNQHNIEGGARPTSLFKMRRMQKKS